MKNIKFLYWLLVLLPILSIAQINVNGNLGNNALIQTLAGPGVVISNVNIVGANGSFGQFTNGGNIGIAQGVLLTSGQINNAVGPNNLTNAQTANGSAGSNLIPNSFDACTVTFNVVPQGNTLSFNYVFGSEEYHEFVNSNFNDAFRFFIQGPGINGMQNMATINGNTNVAINSVNNGFTSNCQSVGPGTNANFFVDNCGGNSTQYDGFTTVLTARANVQPCQTYTITMVIADVGDSVWDSGVFIQAGTITSNAQVAFHFEHQNGIIDTNFNSCETIFLDGSATTNTGSYYLDIWQVNANNTLTWLANQGGNGWANGSPTLINVNQTFPTVNFQLGVTYEVKLAINGPCGWIETTRRFTITSAGISSLFDITEYNCHDGVYDVSVSAQDTNPYQWWGLYETSVEGSILDQDTIFPIVAQQSFVNTHTFTNLNPYKFYYIKHGVWTDNCGWQETRTPVKRDCCTDNPYIVAYCEDPCALDSFPLKVLDKDGNPITLLSGATFEWYNSTTGATSNSDIVTATEFENWSLILTLPDGCIYKMNYKLVCCEANIHLEVYECPTAEDLEALNAQLNSQRNTLDSKTFEKISNYISSQSGLSSRGDCDPCESGLVVIRVVDANGNLVTNFNSIIWNDGLATNQNIRWGYVDTTYSVTVEVFASNGIDTCTYTDDIIYNCSTSECENFTAPTNLQVGGIIGTTLMWDAVPGATHYVVSSPGVGPIRNCKCETPISIVPITTTTNSLALPSSLVNKCFVWIVTAYCADGTSATSEQACYSAKGKDEFVTVSPNPSGGRFKINTEESIDGVIEITDLYGVVIYKHEFKNQQEFDIFMEDRPIGIYIVKVYTNDKVHTTKIIKN